MYNVYSWEKKDVVVVVVVVVTRRKEYGTAWSSLGYLYSLGCFHSPLNIVSTDALIKFWFCRLKNKFSIFSFTFVMFSFIWQKKCANGSNCSSNEKHQQQFSSTKPAVSKYEQCIAQESNPWPLAMCLGGHGYDSCPGQRDYFVENASVRFVFTSFLIHINEWIKIVQSIFHACNVFISKVLRFFRVVFGTETNCTNGAMKSMKNSSRLKSLDNN